VYDITLSNGVTIFIPDLEVEYWEIDGKEEQCLGPVSCRKIDDAISHLFPDYFRRK
jgi:hypothetical protein